jgi:O-antigen/teichoic acid export membrane protein
MDTSTTPKLTSPQPSTSIKPIFMILAISFGGYFASYLMTVLLTRMLGSVSYSAYISTISMISMVALCLLLGVDQGLNKYIPRYFNQKNNSAVAAYLRYSRERTWIQFSIIFIIGLLCSLLIHSLVKYHVLPDNDSTIILSFLWVVPLYAILWYFGNLAQAGGYGYRAVFVLYGSQPVGMLIILGIFWLLHKQVFMSEAIFFYVGVTVVVSAAIIWFNYKKKLVPKDDKKFPAIRDKWSKATVDLFLLLLVSMCSAFLVIIFAQIFSKDAKAAGVLGVLTIICNIFNPVSNGVFALFSPKISTAVATLNSVKVRRLLVLSILASFVPSIIGLVFIILYGKVWLGHFGTDYVDYYLALVLMAITAFTNTLLTPFLWLAQFSKNLAVITRMAVIFFVIFIVISIPLDYFFNVVGAILGFAFLQVGYWLYLFIVVMKNWQQLFAPPITPQV